MLFAVVFTLIWFSNIDYRKLVKTDEGRYAEIAREMAVSGDWVTPRSNGFKYFYKPPLQYWATASAYRVFGTNEWTARLWTVLTAWASVIFTGYAAARIWGAGAGIASACVLAGSAYWVGLGHFAALDMGLASFVSAAVLAFAVAQSSPVEQRRAWMLAAWALAGLAVLSKGLIGAVLPAGALAAYLLWQRDLSLLRHLHWLPGLAVFLAITAPWFILVSLRNPEFAEFFFYREHIARFLTKVHHREGPWWYFVPYLLLGLLPFTTALPAALTRAWARAPTSFQPTRFLLAWAVVVFAFFSVSSSKLPSYILPLVPALAILIALVLREASQRALTIHAAVAGAVGVILATVGPWLLTRRASSDLAALAPAYVPWLIGAGVALVIGAWIAILYARRGANLAGIAALACGGLVSAQLAITGHESFAPVYSSYHMARQIKAELRPDTRLFAVDTYDHTLPFYLERTLTMVAYKDELAAAIDWEPERFLADRTAFERAWRAAPHAMALLSARDLPAFEARALPMRVVARDTRRVIVAKP